MSEMERQTIVCRPDVAGSRMFLGDPTVMEGERMYPIVTLSEETFARMGNPETITVTVELGDTLNPEARREAWQADTSASGTFKCPDAGPELCGPSFNEA